ncbi:MAG: HDIG domain-containing protein [Phycisphaeraceae bacterium]|nr:HDIG domain-containing protein [Phycisphaeraceae bacterium]
MSGLPSKSLAKGTRRSARPRRVSRLRGRSMRERIGTMLQSPRLGWGAAITLLFVAACWSLTVWTRAHPLVASGRVMNWTHVSRVEFKVEDPETTRRKRDEARERTPRVYVADDVLFEELTKSLTNLPATLAGVESLDGVDASIRTAFGLTPEMLAAIRAITPETTPTWSDRVLRLVESLKRRPILDKSTYQKESQEGLHATILLRVGSRLVQDVNRRAVLNLEDPVHFSEDVRAMATQAGLSGVLADLAMNRVRSLGRPTYSLDTGATAAAQAIAAESVEQEVRTIAAGQILFRRGEVLTQAQLDLVRAEAEAWKELAEPWRLRVRNISLLGAVSAIGLAMAGYAVLFCPAVRRNPLRMAALAALAVGMLALACVGTVSDPRLFGLTVTAPTVFFAVIVVIAYDQRVALAFGVLHGILVCISLNQPIGVMALIIVGVGVMVWRLKEIRHRNSLVATAVLDAAAMAVGMVVVSLIDRPITETTLVHAGFDAGWAAVGGLAVGFVSLGLLPTIERLFDITTGMTLIELRDPKQPLLRELQQRAPGTYNHSLNVATIAEAAADAIGADGLLTYVGALYHDIGKINKPEYFVENQFGGPNKHDKLSPAMSLLVIVGHVKDGMEMAREYGLPRKLMHFIEAHHGTTLVEYFFNRAKKQAERPGSDDKDSPSEFEYRYPGPRPRTKEVAILMVADAVESATRTLVEPTPSRIDALVRAIATKRLTDGQFDECDLTLRELQLIVESVSKTLASIYHGRISYASTEQIARNMGTHTTTSETRNVAPGTASGTTLGTASGGGGGAERGTSRGTDLPQSG